MRQTSRRVISDLLTLMVIFGLLGAVYLLPPDTSLAQVKEAGVLRVCLPNRYPPLVTGNPDSPGIDVELLQAIADEMDLRLAINTNSAMGRDFNPRNWRVTRAQCQLLGGGVVDSTMTRSFLEMTQAYFETGWALVLPKTTATLDDARVGFFSATSGLDRIALGRFLNEHSMKVDVVRGRDDLVAGLTSGQFDVGVAEALTAQQIAGEQEWEVKWPPLERYPLVLGLWKGDLTLKRRVVEILDKLEDNGTLTAIIERYNLAPIDK